MLQKILWLTKAPQLELILPSVEILWVELTPDEIPLKINHSPPLLQCGMSDWISTQQRLFEWLKEHWHGELVVSDHPELHFFASYFAAFQNAKSILSQSEAFGDQIQWAQSQAQAILKLPLSESLAVFLEKTQ